LFDRYGYYDPTEAEQAKMDLVKEKYGVSITMEQLAWYRHEFNPNNDEDDSTESANQEILRQELPWDEDEAWITSGSDFFPGDRLSTEMKRVVAQPRPALYRYYMSSDFLSTIVEPVQHMRKAQLRVWQDPDPGGVDVRPAAQVQACALHIVVLAGAAGAVVERLAEVESVTDAAAVVDRQHDVTEVREVLIHRVRIRVVVHVVVAEQHLAPRSTMEEHQRRVTLTIADGCR